VSALRRWAKALSNVSFACIALKAVCMPIALLTEDASSQVARLEYVTRAVTKVNKGGADNVVAGEWSVGALSMAAAAAVQLNAADPSHLAERRADVDLFSREILKEATARFDSQLWREPALETLDGPNGHIGYLGHTALTLAADCALGGTEHDAQLIAIADALARRLDAAEDGLLETYPRQRWIPDNLVVGAALAQTDRCHHETKYAATLTRFGQLLRERWRDKETGLLMFTPEERPRGSGATWDTFYLAMFDEPLAREQWSLCRKHFEAAPFPGLGGFREFLPGVNGHADVDSGPVIFGISTSAGGFGFGGASLEGDSDLVTKLRRTAELFGFSLGPPRHYVAAPLVGEAIVLAMSTARSWTPGPATTWGGRHPQ
jgi:hypothetical protein